MLGPEYTAGSSERANDDRSTQSGRRCAAEANALQRGLRLGYFVRRGFGRLAIWLGLGGDWWGQAIFRTLFRPVVDRDSMESARCAEDARTHHGGDAERLGKQLCPAGVPGGVTGSRRFK